MFSNFVAFFSSETFIHALFHTLVFTIRSMGKNRLEYNAPKNSLCILAHKNVNLEMRNFKNDDQT